MVNANEDAKEAGGDSAGPGIDELAFDQRLAVFRSLRDSGKTITLRARGMSMRPLIRPETEVEIGFREARDVRPGDVILFHTDSAFVLHRVMAVLRENERVFFVEKGDHQPFSSTVAEARYLGLVTSLRTRRRPFRRDSAAGRFQAGLFLLLGRLEMFLYRVKVRIWGREPTRTGRFVNRALLGLRGAVLRLVPGRGRKGGGG